MASTTPSTGTIIFVAVIAFSIYRRIRRNFGRRPLKTGTMATYVVLYGVLSFGIALISLLNLNVLAGYGGGLVAGVILGVAGLRLTSYERAPEGLFYRPNKYLGSAILLFWIARMGYRMSTLPDFDADSPPAATDMSPLTLMTSGLLLGYYFTYYTGLLIRSRRMI